MNIPDSFVSACVVLEAASGARLNTEAYEALEFAFVNKCKVMFTHNDRNYLINPHDIVTEILKQHPL